MYILVYTGFWAFSLWLSAAEQRLESGIIIEMSDRIRVFVLILCTVGFQISVAMEYVSCIDFLLNIVEQGVISVGDDGF